MRNIPIWMICAVLLVFFAAGCSEENVDGEYKHSPFVTEYSAEEHLEKIRAITEERLKAPIAYGLCEILSVDTVYAFDDKPEYFLVEIAIAKNGFIDEPYSALEIKHIIGYIENDCYSTGLYDYAGFRNGPSVYRKNGVSDARKYYGATVHGYRNEKGVFSLTEKDAVRPGKMISESKFTSLVENNPKFLCSSYAETLNAVLDVFCCEHLAFASQYTEAGHLARIRNETETVLSEQIDAGRCSVLTVDTVYAFDGSPEYFLVEIAIAGKTSDTDEIRHVIGYIRNDEYYVGLYGYGDFRNGPSIYRREGVLQLQKFYGVKIQAARISGDIVSLGKLGEETFEGNRTSVPESDFEYLTRCNPKWNVKSYEEALADVFSDAG